MKKGMNWPIQLTREDSRGKRVDSVLIYYVRYRPNGIYGQPGWFFDMSFRLKDTGAFFGRISKGPFSSREEARAYIHQFKPSKIVSK